MLSNFSPFFSLFIILTYSGGTTAAEPTAPLTTKPAKTIVMLGDSVTEGYGVELTSAYPQLIAKLFVTDKQNIKIISSAISGSTSASALSRMKWISKSKPDIVFICLGANDGLRGAKTENIKKNLKVAIEFAKANGIKVLLAGMKMPPNYGVTYNKKFQNIYSELATEERVPFYPFLLEGVGGRPDLNQTDGIHPNEKGHKIIADKVYEFLKKNL